MLGLEDSLKACEAKIKSDVEEGRVFEPLVRDIFRHESGSFYEIKASGRPVTSAIRGGTLTEMPPLVSRVVTPVDVRFQWSGAFRESYSSGFSSPPIGVVMRILRAESKAFIDSLSTGLPEVAVSASEFDTSEAQDLVLESGNFANRLLVNPTQISNLRHISGFIDRWSLPQGYSNRVGPRHLGRFGALDVFENEMVPAEVGILYDRGECCIKMSELKAFFDNYSNPRLLSVEEKIHAWVVDEGSAVLINIT